MSAGCMQQCCNSAELTVATTQTIAVTVNEGEKSLQLLVKDERMQLFEHAVCMTNST